MITHPRIKSKYHIETVEGEGIYLLSENERHVLEGDSLQAVVPLLSGRRSWDEIISATAGSLERDAALEACKVLVDHGHVEQPDPFIPPEMQIFWGELGRDAASARALVSRCNIQLVMLGEMDSVLIRQSIHGFGFQQDGSRVADMVIVVADDYQNPEISEINSRAIANGTPWILIKPNGLLPMVGPFFMPGRSACWKCLEARIGHNREVESYLMRRKGRAEPFPITRAQIPLAQMQVISMTLFQLARWLVTGQNQTLEGKITAINIVNGEQTHHVVTRRPQCPCCGSPAGAHVGGRPLKFTAQTLTDQGENGFRLETPDITFQRYAHHVSEITGVVKHILPSPQNGMGPIKTYVAGHNFALKNDGLYFIKDGLRSASSGKGKSDAQARTSALCEALERFSGLYRGEEDVQVASMNMLGEEAVDPRTVSLFSDTQYREREKWHSMGERFQVVPQMFDPDAEIAWSPIWSHSENKRKLLPTSMLYYGYSDGEDKFFFWGDSNGNAAGSCLEDATLQGFLELVERDAVALWWYNRVQRPQVDLSSLKDPYIEQMFTFYNQHNREFWVLNLTADLDIPVFAAINRRREGEAEDIVIGFGAHLDARVAIMRALTEMNQFMPALLTRNPDGTTAYGFDDHASIKWWKTARLEEQTYLQPLADSAQQLTDLPAEPTGNVLEHLKRCFNSVEALGMEVLVLDQTRPDIGLPVVKVIVPGMRHFWARFAEGRLYDVPVNLGWLKNKLRESELNPIPMFV